MPKIDCLQFNLCGINLWRLLGLYLASLPCNPSDIPLGSNKVALLSLRST